MNWFWWHQATGSPESKTTTKAADLARQTFNFLNTGVDNPSQQPPVKQQSYRTFWLQLPFARNGM
jgi:hypothetical protein